MGRNYKLDMTIAIFGVVIVLVINLIPSRSNLNLDSRNWTYDTTRFGFPSPFLIYHDLPFYDDPYIDGDPGSPTSVFEFKWIGASIDFGLGLVFVLLWTFLVRKGLNTLRGAFVSKDEF